MATPKRNFSPHDQPEVFLTTAATSRAVRRAVANGEARKIAGRLYTRNTSEPLEAVARRNWQRIAGLLFPGAVVVDRSAFEAMPSEDGSVFLDAGPDYAARRPVRLPGLTLRPRRGPGPIAADMPFMDGLHFSGPGRKFIDNLRPSRAQDGGVARTLFRAELEDELTRAAALRGTGALNEIRDQAREAAAPLGAEGELATLDDLIASILGTADAPLATAGARAHHEGLGFDPRRIELFELLQIHLLRNPQPGRPEQAESLPTLPFIEAYFSNWIEGTEFELGEAERLVFAGAVPRGRSEDAHDVLGTFELVSDEKKRARVPVDADDLLEILRSHHALMLARRPTALPGSFKERPNRAGGTTFVHPDLVAGTLIEGYRYYASLPAGLPRAVFMMFLVAEVHPFADGNGRVARVLMNAELSAAGMQRIVVPLSFRDEYLTALRALSRGSDPRPLVRVLDFAQEYAAAIDWSDLDRAERTLQETNAFVPPDVAEAEGLRLRLPASAPQT
jgi:hypothetical protein